MPKVQIEEGHLVFESGTSYDKLFELSQKNREDFITSFESSDQFTSLREKQNTSSVNNQRIINGCNVPDSVIENNSDLFSILDANGVVRIGNDLYRYDYCNDKVFIIAYSIAYQGNNYNDFLAGNTSNSNVGWFPTYVDVQDAVTSGYRSMPDPKTVTNNEIFRQGAAANSLNEWKHFYDMEDDGSVPENTRMDGLIAYDKFGIYFHLYGKEKYQRSGWLGWTTASTGGTRNWLVNYQFQYQRKGQSTGVSGNGTLNAPSSTYDPNKVEADFYGGGRGLLSFYARWDVRNYTRYHYVNRRANGSSQLTLIGSYQNYPTNTAAHIYNYSFNLVQNFGPTSYFQITG